MDLTKFEYLKHELAYDWYDKNSFIDHITDDSFSLEAFKLCSFKEFGDFANQPFEINDASENHLQFVRNGGIYDEEMSKTSIKKTFTVSSSGIGFEIVLDTESKKSYNYICEINIHLPDVKQVVVNDKAFSGEAFYEKIYTLSIRDKVLEKVIAFRFDSVVDAYVYPVDTVSQNEEGFELSNQSLCFGFVLPISKNMIFSGRLDLNVSL
jgi:hypothetical protein